MARAIKTVFYALDLVFRHLIDFLAVQHQMRCKSVWLIKTDSQPAREEYRIFHSIEPTERSLKQSASSDTESAEVES